MSTVHLRIANKPNRYNSAEAYQLIHLKKSDRIRFTDNGIIIKRKPSNQSIRFENVTTIIFYIGGVISAPYPIKAWKELFKSIPII